MTNEMTVSDATYCMRKTLEHKLRVADLLLSVTSDILNRAVHHDDSKFSEDEFESFAKVTQKLSTTTYGSEEYRANLASIKPAIEHHNEHNRHHPEYHENGVHDMTLVDLVEMLCDWKAASERHNDGDIARSIKINAERFQYDEGIQRLLFNTAVAWGFIDASQNPFIFQEEEPDEFEDRF